MVMGFQCDDVKARMMDLLYGELAGDDRKSVEGHVAGCVRCQAELAGFQRTRASVRGALEQSPPARARDSILRAATAQAAALAASHAAAEKPVRQPAPPPRTSIWEWLRRRWALPTLATIGAVAVFLLASQMFLRPEKMMPGTRTDDSVIGEGAPEKAAPAAAAEKARLAAAPVPDPSTPSRSRVAAAPEGLAEPEPPKGSGSPVAGVKPSELGGRPHRAAVKKDSVARDKSEDHRAPSPAVGVGSSRPEPMARFAAPPPPPRAPAAGAIANLAPPQPAAEQQQAAKKAKRALDSEGSESAATSAGAVSSSLAKAAPADELPAVASSPMSDESSGERRSRRRSGKASSAEEEAESPVQRADRLFARARWAEAAVAYRRLLQQAPDSADAPRWRQRLAAAEKNARDNAGLEPTP
jgi:hypothetical protein